MNDNELPEDVENDMIHGADKIAAFLGGDWTAPRVYRVSREGSWPIWKEAGLGLVSSKSALRAHLKSRIVAAVAKAAAVSWSAA